MRTHWHMPDRHIRAVEVGDSFIFEGRQRLVRDVKRGRDGSKRLMFADGLEVLTSAPEYDTVTVDLVRGPRAKFVVRKTAA